VCIPLGEGAQMLGWREWSKVKIKRPSGVTIDHAGVSVQLTGSSVCWGGGSPLLSSYTACRSKAVAAVHSCMPGCSGRRVCTEYIASLHVDERTTD
jgi:hypothetical protein